MKKFLAILLAMMLVMVSVAALADETPTDKRIIPEGQEPVASSVQSFTITKSFTVVAPTTTTQVDKTGEDGKPITDDEGNPVKEDKTVSTGLVPANTPTFTVTEVNVTNCTTGTTFPKKPTEEHEKTPANGYLTVTSAAFAEGDTSADLTITVPAYTAVGQYNYTFKELDGNIAGVQYDTTTAYSLHVTVINDKGTLKIGGLALRKGAATNKIDVVDNEYDAGSLIVSKTVTGTLGDYDKDFTFTYTFTAPAGDSIGSTVSWTKTKNDGTTATGTIASSAWTKSTTTAPYSYSTTFTLKHNENIRFDNLPAGVTYTVVEDDYSSENYTTTPNTRTYSGTVAKQGEPSHTFTNTNTATVDTGITLETLPYVLMMALAMMGLVALKLRKREEY